MKKSNAGRLLLAALALSASAAFAVEIAFNNLSLTQGFNFKKDVQDSVGFVTALTLEGQALKADLTVTDPTAAKAAVVGVLKSVKWDGGKTSPIALKFNVSAANKAVIQGLLKAKPAKTTAAFGFTIWQFDQKTAKYGVAFQTQPAGQSLDALIAKEGKTKLLLALPSSTANDAVKSPQNWDVELSVMPAPKEQTLKFFVSPTAPMVKTWGVKVVN